MTENSCFFVLVMSYAVNPPGGRVGGSGGQVNWPAALLESVLFARKLGVNLQRTCKHKTGWPAVYIIQSDVPS